MGKFNDMVNWGCKNLIWLYNFGFFCCYVEMVILFIVVYDVVCFGVEVLCVLLCQVDLMVVVGICFIKMVLVIQCLYDQMLELKWVILMGVCVNFGGMYDIYFVVQGVDKFILVDVYILGCLLCFEVYMQVLMLLQEFIGKECCLFFWVVGDQGVYCVNM